MTQGQASTMDLDTDFKLMSVIVKKCEKFMQFRTGSPAAAASRVKKAAVIDMIYTSTVILMGTYMIYRGFADASYDEFGGSYASVNECNNSLMVMVEVNANFPIQVEGHSEAIEMKSYGLGITLIASASFIMSYVLYKGAKNRSLVVCIAWLIWNGPVIVAIVGSGIITFLDAPYESEPNWDLLKPWIFILVGCGAIVKSMSLLAVLGFLLEIRPRFRSSREGNEAGIAEGEQDDSKSN